MSSDVWISLHFDICVKQKGDLQSYITRKGAKINQNIPPTSKVEMATGFAELLVIYSCI